jgi:copper chaperone
MCGCAAHRDEQTRAKAAERNHDALAFRVDDMTCNHCAGAIKKAIETSLPGTQVEADPQTKVVSVKGASDFETLSAIVTRAGYTAA